MASQQMISALESAIKDEIEPRVMRAPARRSATDPRFHLIIKVDGAAHAGRVIDDLRALERRESVPMYLLYTGQHVGVRVL